MSSKFAKHERIKIILDAFEQGLKPLGFDRRGVSEHYVRKTREGTEVLFFGFYSVRGAMEPTVVVAPSVQVNFHEEQRVADLIGRSKGLPSVGGLLHLFSTTTHIEMQWRVSLTTDLAQVEAEIWDAVERWAVPFWEKFSSMEATIRVIEAEGHRHGPTPYWFDLAAMYYLVRGPEAAISYVRGLNALHPKPDVKGKALRILQSLAAADFKMPKLSPTKQATAPSSSKGKSSRSTLR